MKKTTKANRYNKFKQDVEAIFRNLPKLTKEEYEIFRNKFNNGDKNIIDELFNKSLHQVVDAVAFYYCAHAIENVLPFDDGLTIGIEHFNTSLNKIKFLPPLLCEYNHSVINLIVFRKLNYEYLKEAKRLNKLDLLNFDEMSNLINQLENDHVVTWDMLNKNFKYDINKILISLTEREKVIFKMRYGINNGKEMLVTDIAKELGITRAGVYDVLTRAHKKILEAENLNMLKDYNELDMGI